VVIKTRRNYALALQVLPPKDLSPVVVATGMTWCARIINWRETGVYVTENRPLARALIGGGPEPQNPEQFYKPVATTSRSSTT
jgi:flagellar biosynthesis protein FlhB